MALLEKLTRAAANPPLAATDNATMRSAAARVPAVGATGETAAAEPPSPGRPSPEPAPPHPPSPEPASPTLASAGPAGGSEATGSALAAGSPSGNGATAASAWPQPAADHAVPLGDRPAREILPDLVRRPWKRLQRAVAGLGEDPPDPALHEVRIRAKRIRYAAEAAAGVIGKPARRLAGAVAELQGVLGDMQDAVVAESWLRQAATSMSAAQALTAGELVTLQRQQQQDCRSGWPAAWKAASAKRLRSWLKG